MSELIVKQRNIHSVWRLMASTSALTLIASICAMENATAHDTDRPTVWIELGGQLERLESSQPSFDPLFLDNATATLAPVSHLDAQRAPRYSNGAEGKLTFEPAGTDWLLSAGVRYGRSNGAKHIHQQTHYHSSTFGQYPYAFTDVRAKDRESHMVLDFQAGKDWGLGMFGRGGRSALTIGVRYAQFVSKADVSISHNPTSNPYGYRHFYQTGHIDRSFTGIGPSLAWDGSAAILGGADTSTVTFDWGANFALLFGRQKSDVAHNTHANRRYVGLVYSTGAARSPSKSVTVPNLGGFAGFSVRYDNAKVSFGYRADYFLGAIDGGLDTRDTKNLSFHGPFAAISLGFGG
jgi:hypothetical protein